MDIHLPSFLVAGLVRYRSVYPLENVSFMKSLSLIIIAITCLTVACVSDPHYVNLNKKTLGYTDYPVAKGLTTVSVENYGELWPTFSFVRSNFLRRAHYLCPNGFTLLEEDEAGMWYFLGQGRVHYAFKVGSILCNDSVITKDKAVALLKVGKSDGPTIRESDFIVGTLPSCFSDDKPHTAFLAKRAEKNLSSHRMSRYDKFRLQCLSEALTASASNHDKLDTVKQIIELHDKANEKIKQLIKITELYRIEKLLEE